MRDASKRHWPEYGMEAVGLGLFMISACAFGAIIEHPASPLRQMIDNAHLRRMLMGTAMGLTAVANTYSPWGQRSGAHLNPSFTLAFMRLGKVAPRDALFYVIAQFAGGITGVLIASLFLDRFISHPSIRYVATTPGPGGLAVAFAAEAAISFILMTVVLNVSNGGRLSRYTGLFAGILVAAYITLEAPLSGMSMNPARTFGSAFSARTWTALWIYFTAPPLGMLLASELFLRRNGAQRVLCAKLHHNNNKRCIFRCGFVQTEVGGQRLAVSGH